MRQLSDSQSGDDINIFDFKATAVECETTTTLITTTTTVADTTTTMPDTTTTTMPDTTTTTVPDTTTTTMPDTTTTPAPTTTTPVPTTTTPTPTTTAAAVMCPAVRENRLDSGLSSRAVLDGSQFILERYRLIQDPPWPTASVGSIQAHSCNGSFACSRECGPGGVWMASYCNDCSPTTTTAPPTTTTTPLSTTTAGTRTGGGGVTGEGDLLPHLCLDWGGG